MPEVKIGALCWNQYTDWPALLEAGDPRRSSRIRHRCGPGTTSTRSSATRTGPIFEGWLTLAAWAQATERIRIGLMVGANTFRNPALVAKMATTLDHVSGGRAILGIGGAWFEREHEASGSSSAPGSPSACAGSARRSRSCAGCSTGPRRRRPGPRYLDGNRAICPAPVQARLPICIGGGGEQVTLKLVAKYGDMNNVGDGVETVKRKEAILLEHCAAVGRDPAEIERTTGIGTVFIRDDRAEAERLFRAAFEQNRVARLWEDQPVGTPEDVAEMLAPYVEIGYRHLIAAIPATYDEESMTRLVTEVKPMLEAQPPVRRRAR